MENPDGVRAVMEEAGLNYDFWLAVIAAVYALASEYIGQHPEIKQNTVYQLVATLIKGKKK